MDNKVPDIIFETISFLGMAARHWMVGFSFGKLAETLLGEHWNFHVPTEKIQRKSGNSHLLEKIKGYRVRMKKRYLVAGGYFAAMLFFKLLPFTVDSFFVYLAGVLAVFLILLLEDRKNIRVEILFCVTFFSLRYHIVSGVSQISMALFELESSLFHRLTSYRYVQAWQIPMLLIFVQELLELLCDYMVLSGVTALLAKYAPFGEQQQEPTGKETMLLAMPGVLGSLCYFLISWIRTEVELQKDVVWMGPKQYFSIWLVTFLMNFLSIASMVVLWKLFQELAQKQEEEKRQGLLESQIREMQSHIREIEQLYAGIRGMKHDVKNYISVMELLMDQQNYGEARKFLGSMEQAMGHLEYIHKTGNPVTDVIINEKCSHAERKNIEFKSKFYFTKDLGLDVFGISVILSNGLENALEAAGQELGHREITVRSRRQKQVFLIEIQNTFTGVLDWEEKSGLPQSSKQDQSCHGLGLKNIRRAAEQYGGDIDIEAGNGVFTLTVMLNLNHL